MRAREIRIWQTIRRALERLAGMPDYDGYVTHLRQHHPERSVPGVREFYREYLESRYDGRTGRCC